MDHGFDDVARLEELPSDPGTIAAARAAAAGISLGDPDKPKGPDYDEMHVLATALASEQLKARVKWRKANRRPSEEVDGNDEVAAENRLKVANPETQQAYLVRGRGMLKRFERETGIRIEIEDIDPRQFVNWLLGLKPVLTINTWRNYRAAAAAVVQSIPSEHIDEALGMLYADLNVGMDEGRPGFNSKGKEKSGEIGASLPARRMEHQHYESLVHSLRLTSRRRAVEWLMDWLRAGINTGLRPNEWTLTSIERRPDRRYPHGERIWLHVVTGKAAEGRGTYRTLDISNFSRETLESVERMVARSREWVMAGRYAQRHGEVSRLFRKTCQVLFPRMQKHYTLYSLRHQFISNMKTLYSREELAAMASHVSVDTQVERDGKKRLSWTKGEIVEIPMPVEEQVKQVKKRIEPLDVRRRLRR
jgi:hypothetical protein